MRLFSDRKAQSMVEYVILIAIVVSALLIMQVFVKRGFQGGLRDSADKMGEQFSAGQTSVQRQRAMENEQVILEEVATQDNTGLDQFVTVAGQLEGTLDKGAYSYNERTGGTTVSNVMEQTDSYTTERTRWTEYESDEQEQTPFDDPWGP